MKEPQAEEYGLLRPDLVLFTFLHLAAYPGLADVLLGGGDDGHRLRDGARGRRGHCRCWRP